ncbi:hypothetical protein KUTeg_024678 [Tegillarca granosa]|uniref:SLC26A/SulP transporter domain-containing protein n=1 Tax=Tegillarca granosa TaxID=220873 RepID=A0ABQ9DYS0_TEGGR|nr:hypothetical protein KUTeg_024678 [Tegillarca granosa]
MNNNAYKDDDDAGKADIDKNDHKIKIEDDSASAGNDTGGYRTETFRSEYRQPDPEPLTPKEKCKKVLKAISNKCSKKSLTRLFPIPRIYSKYRIKTDLPNDAIAGFTVGIMQLPQGMAYAMLADLPPVVGLYMSFFPVLIYFLLGTSRQISMGTVAVVSLMIGSIVSKIGLPTDVPTSDENLTSTTMALTTFNTSSYDNSSSTPVLKSHSLSDLDLQKIAMASTMCLMVGLVQVLFGACRLGFVTTYMSEPLVSGFTTGAAVHVFTSQVKYIFGLNIPRYPNLLQIVYTYKAIITNLHLTNLPTLLTSAICIIILYLVKVHVNYRFKDKMKIPIPIELIVVVAATVLSHFFTFNKSHGIKVVGTIPAGLPSFKVPSLAGSSDYFSDAVIIGIVAFAQSVSLAALMAKKHKYKIDASQEFIAYGVGNIFGSFFSCYPFAASVSRSSVQDSAGGKSQIASLFSATLVLIVILVIGPLFESLPNCVLASIIVVALRSMFYQFFELRELWKISVYDFLIWIVTFGACCHSIC